MKKILALVLAAVMMLAMSTAAFAAEPSTPEIVIKAASTQAEGATDTTEYTWYRIFEADIDEDPTQSGAAQSGGKVAYYVDSSSKAEAIEGTGLFEVTRLGTTDKWYVALKDGKDAEDIETAFAAMDKSAFATGTFSQSAPGQTATSGEVAPGYYYIVSTAGMNAVIQTLTKVEIDEKNTFPTTDKTRPETDASAQIGDIITYTLTVVVPASANDEIVLTDTMTGGLTFKEITSVKNSDGDDVAYTPQNADAEHQTFTLTFAKAAVEANRGKTITIEYKAILNENAFTSYMNTNEVKINYGNKYESKPKEVTTTTQAFRFDKVDGTSQGTKLPGAVFELRRDGKALELVSLGNAYGPGMDVYRIAVEGDQSTVTSITTTGNQVGILGVDADITYQLVETDPPTGYNLPANPSIDVTPTTNNMYYIKVLNEKGTVLPSTGGMGTTLFYLFGAALVLGGAVILVTRRRMGD